MNKKKILPGGGSLAACSVFYGAIPVLVAVTGGEDFPFVFATAFALGSALSAFGYLAVFHKGIWSDWKLFIPRRESVLKSLNSHQTQSQQFPAWNWQVLASLPRGLNVGFFALAVTFIPEIVAAVLVESWPAFYVLLLQWMFVKDENYVIPVNKVLLMWVAFLGVCMVVLSAEAKSGDVSSIMFSDLLLGVIFIALSIAFTISNAASVRWSESVMAWLKNSEIASVRTNKELEKQKLGYFILLRCCGQAFSFMIALALSGFSLGDASWTTFLVIVFGSAIITTGGSYFNGKGTFRSSVKPQVQSVRYLTPVFGVLFLLAASHAGGVNGWLFGIGFALVLAGNLFANVFRQNRI